MRARSDLNFRNCEEGRHTEARRIRKTRIATWIARFAVKMQKKKKLILPKNKNTYKLYKQITLKTQT